MNKMPMTEQEKQELAANLRVLIKCRNNKIPNFDMHIYGSTEMSSIAYEAYKILKDVTKKETVVETIKSHPCLGSFLGQFGIQVGDQIKIVKKGDTIIDYEDGSREIKRSGAK